jgi:uncharacterized membrane-anchored protein YhcB (DUF1043 family)
MFKTLWSKPIVKILTFIIVGFLVLSIVAWAANSFPRQSVVDQIIKDREVEIDKKYKEQIAEKDAQIGSLNEQIAQSEKEYANLKKTYLNLKKAYSNVEKPKDVQETKRRLNDMGYPTK